MANGIEIINIPAGGNLSASQIIDYAKPPVTRQGGQNLGIASHQWASRPDDERFLSLEDLLAYTDSRRDRSDEFPNVPIIGNLDAKYVAEGPLAGNLYTVSYGDSPAIFTNWSFSQYNSAIGGPDIRWLRDMPAPVAKMALNSSIEYRQRVDGNSTVKLLATPPNGDDPAILRSVTGPEYGRIWDADIVRAIMLINDRADGRWVVPGKIAGGGMADMYTEVSKQSTTLYASDRDFWSFLVDEQHPVEVEGETYFRGFIVSNSEVGDAKFNVLSFYLSKVCQNRTIWDAIGMKQFSIRHNSRAPRKFLESAIPAIAAFSNASTAGVVEHITKAKHTTVAQDIAGAEKFLREQGFSQAESKVIPLLAERAQDIGSSGDPTTIWDLLAGSTAYAREFAHADSRVAFEQRSAAALTKFVSVN